jgi:hypothetical protein
VTTEARPFRVRLGEAARFIFEGLPPGVPLERLAPHPCQAEGCAAIVYLKARRYCDAHRVPWAHWAPKPPRGRACRACGQSLTGAPPKVRYCDPCRAKPRCVACRRLLELGHAPRCLALARTPRVPLPYQGVVSEADVLTVYLDAQRVALRVARRILGDEGEDVVQDVVAYFWGRRDTLREFSAAYFVWVVKLRAILWRRRRAARWQHVVCADDLVALERSLVRQGREWELAEGRADLMAPGTSPGETWAEAQLAALGPAPE